MRRNAEEIELLLRERGLVARRRSGARSCACLTEHGGHWTAAEMLERVTGEFPMASRATVYSTLALLRDLGVLAAVATPGGELRFDADPEPHQHFVCLRCGELEDVPEAGSRSRRPPSLRRPSQSSASGSSPRASARLPDRLRVRTRAAHS